MFLKVAKSCLNLIRDHYHDNQGLRQEEKNQLTNAVFDVVTFLVACYGRLNRSLCLSVGWSICPSVQKSINSPVRYFNVKKNKNPSCRNEWIDFIFDRNIPTLFYVESKWIKLRVSAWRQLIALIKSFKMVTNFPMKFCLSKWQCNKMSCVHILFKFCVHFLKSTFSLIVM